MDEWLLSLDEDVIRHARVLPLDITEANGHGHAGTAVSLTPAPFLLFQDFLRHDPHDPTWIGRDRFVLSCGHASLALYLQLYLSGYGLTLDDLRSTRRLGSLTPGHPEYGLTAGVEMSTGPLGQGVAAAVGMSMAGRRLRELLDPADTTTLFEHRVWVLASDGDLQEGVAYEAAALAGRLGLGNLVLLWDDNGITIDGRADRAWAEDVPKRFRAQSWDVITVNESEDLGALRKAFKQAVGPRRRPLLVQLRSRIGHPMPTMGGTAAAHAGPVGAAEVAATKELLGLDPAQQFVMPNELVDHSREVANRGAVAHRRWDAELANWRERAPEGADLLDRLIAGGLPDFWHEALPEFDPGSNVATRTANSQVLTALTPLLPELWGGSCDLASSTSTTLPGTSMFASPPPVSPSDTGPGDALGEDVSNRRTIAFGVREHAMGGVLSGIALAGLSRAFGSTYLVFSDYMRPAIRLAALMELQTIYMFTHDSLAVGEDGPTHQPVEHLWSLRSLPGLTVLRPADGPETAAAWHRLLSDPGGPIALILSRQDLPVLEHDHASLAKDVARGGYVLAGGKPDADVLLIATGSEVHLCVDARKELQAQGVEATIVSMPCIEWFEGQDAHYRDRVLPPTVRARVSVEAGTDTGWYRWVGLDGQTVGVDDFGQSGPGAAVMEHGGITTRDVVAAALASIGNVRAPVA